MITNKLYYTSGEFAKKANVTIRTIRYYDKVGLLSPSCKGANGYRLYSDEDFIKLQQILSLKYLGFSLDEIRSLLANDNVDILSSLQLQLTLVKKHIRHLQAMEQALTDTSSFISENKEINWNEILNLIHMTNMENVVAEHYKNSSNLDIRISLHDKYSTNPKGWFPWLYETISPSSLQCILEIGCGNGQLWTNSKCAPKYLCLSDISEGMLVDAKENLKHLPYSIDYKRFSCENIPFENNKFDKIIANHVLFYIKSLPTALLEILRTLQPNGIFYCSTYGISHMKEVTNLVKEFNPKIILSDVNLYDVFGLHNGEELLSQYFSHVEKVLYKDTLFIDNATPLFDYILSCHGNQRELLANDYTSFKQFLEKKIKKDGGITITKEAGLFICKNT